MVVGEALTRFPYPYYYKTAMTVLLGMPSPVLFVARTRNSISFPRGWLVRRISVFIAEAA